MFFLGTDCSSVKEARLMVNTDHACMELHRLDTSTCQSVTSLEAVLEILDPSTALDNAPAAHQTASNSKEQGNQAGCCGVHVAGHSSAAQLVYRGVPRIHPITEEADAAAAVKDERQVGDAQQFSSGSRHGGRNAQVAAAVQSIRRGRDSREMQRGLSELLEVRHRGGPDWAAIWVSHGVLEVRNYRRY